MLGSQAISWEEYSKAISGAITQLEQAYTLQKMGYSGAIQANTTQAYSAIVTSTQQENLRGRETPAERTNRILKESQEIERRQTEYAKQTAQALQNIKTVRLGGN